MSLTLACSPFGEAIANALGHGDPTSLKIRLSYQDGCVELTVEDDGSGFEYSPESRGFGILGMQKRARDIGSRLELLSTPGTGTQVRVQANLHELTLRNRVLTVIKSRLKDPSS